MDHKGQVVGWSAIQTRRAVHPREGLAWTLAIGGIATAAALALMPFRVRPPSPLRFIVSSPPGTTIGVAENRTRIAISPDGRRLAIVASTEGRQQIWVRSLDSLSAELLPGTDGAMSPFWSPDSRFIGFFSPGEGALKKVEVTGGPVRTIGPAQADGVATWGHDGTILFTQFLGGIYRVSADGGTPIQVTQPDKAKRELNHYWPEFLPDGRHFLYMATSLEATGVRATPSVYVASLDSPQTTLLTRMHSRMTYAPPGYLLFVQDGALLAQPFDAATLQLSGEPAQVADGLAYVRTLGNGAFAVSTGGVLAYQGAGEASRTVWFDRRGNATETGWAAQNYGTVRFSPDGHSVVVDVYHHEPGRRTSGSTTCREARPFDSHRIPLTRAGPCGRRTVAASCSECRAADPRAFECGPQRRISTRRPSARAPKSFSCPTRVPCRPRTGHLTAAGSRTPRHSTNGNRHLAHAAGWRSNAPTFPKRAVRGVGRQLLA